MENSQLASDGRLDAEIILTLRRDADKRNGGRAASSFERFKLLRHSTPAAGHTVKNAHAGPIPYIGPISAQPESRST